MAFFWLLQKCSFPYRVCDPSKMSDALLLQRLKEEFCHVDLVKIMIVNLMFCVIIIDSNLEHLWTSRKKFYGSDTADQSAEDDPASESLQVK
jgi:hypothetical protein